MRVMTLALTSVLVGGCSLLTDFSVPPAGSDGGGGSGGRAVDAAIDARVDAAIDARVDARIDAPRACSSDLQCDDGDACTVDRCNLLAGACGHTPATCPAACDSNLGCVACVRDTDCVKPDCCSTMRCHNNTCEVATGCGRNGNPSTCCSSLGGCLGCRSFCPP